MSRGRSTFRNFAAALALVFGVFTGGAGWASESSISASLASPDFGEFWFVEFSNAPAADGTARAQLARERNAFRREAAAAGIEFSERYNFQDLWNGLSIRTSPSNLVALRSLRSVKAVYPVEKVTLDFTLEEVSPDLFTALGMTGADNAQAAGFDGAGVRVGVIDSGINYHHPDLGGCFGPGCRVQVGWDFVGDFFDAGTPGTPILPDNDPDDCADPANLIPGRPQAAGHGTHVAGIVGANGDPTAGGALGAAPGVTFGAYRVFGCSGSTFTDIILAAMEMAHADGMDIINMSIGAAFSWPQFPTAQASDRLVREGVVVVASAGNSGASGLYSGGAPGLGDEVIGVGSVANTHLAQTIFRVAGEDIPFSVMTNANPAPTSGTEEIVFIGRACDGDPLEADPAGKVALSVRGDCPFREKAENAIAAGATAAIVHNNVPGAFAGTVGAPPLDFTVLSISQESGLFIRAQAAPIMLTWTDELGSFPNPGGGLTSGFSAYGLTPDLKLKPDITAPGGAIRSTYPLAFGTYATLSGTSMSAPHVAGNAAQLLQANPGLSPRAVRTLLQNNAQPILWWGNPGLGFLDNAHRQGAGLVQIDRAIDATATVEPGKISLGKSSNGTTTVNLMVRNEGSSPVTFALSHQPALSTGPNTFAVGFFTGFAQVSFNRPQITVPAGASRGVSVKIEENPGLQNNSIYGGYIVFSGSDGSTIRVPYAGLKGDYLSIQVLQPTAFGFPWLAQLEGGTFFNRPDGATYTMVGNDVPFILLHAAHQSRRLTLSVTDANTGQNWHSFVDAEYVRRHADQGTLDFFFQLPWNGVTFNPGGRPFLVPDGQYVIEVRVQKALGTPSDVEVWTSPVITIERP